MSPKIKIILAVGVILLVTLACDLPFQARPTAIVFPTPNATMTALFSMVNVTATPVTPVVQVITATNPPATMTYTPTTVPTSTATPVPPTATEVPTDTAVVVYNRSNSSASAAYLSTAPDINGNWGDWSTKQYSSGYLVYGKANWTGEADLDSAYRIGWDKTYLYVAVKVKDDTYVQNESGDNMYKGDSVEILLDTNLTGDFYTQALNSDDYQLGLNPGKGDINGPKDAFLWFPRSKTGGVQNVNIGSSLIDGGWMIEAAIPWSTFNIKPYTGMHLGFVLSVSDDDNPDKAVQQSMVSSDPHRVLTDPTTWGDLYLVH
jgi:hypothetical protein